MAVGVFSFGIVTRADDESLVDTQETAVATNLGLFGGSPQDIQVDPNNDGLFVYVATYTPNGVFSSSDGGVTWFGISGDEDYGAGKAIAIDSVTGDVYAAIGDNVIKSTDHGETWTSLTANMVDHPIVGGALAWADDTVVVAVEDAKLQVTNDGGETFSEVTLVSDTDHIAISLTGDTDGTFYAVLQNSITDASRLFRSTDNAATWTEMDLTSAGVTSGSQFYAIAIDPLNEDHLVLSSYHPDYNSYHTFNGGTSWTALMNGSLRIGGQEGQFDGVGGMYLGAYYSSDMSVPTPVWSPIETVTPLSSVRGDIYAVDAVHPTTVFSNTSLGVAKSEDNGATWVDSVDGITAVKTYAVAQADDKDVVWLGADGGLAKTNNFTDESPDWEYPITPTESGGTIYAVVVKPDDGNYVVTGSANFLYYTTDGGDTWTQADAPDFLGTVEDIIPSAVDDQTLYVAYLNTSLTEDAYNGGVLMSTDAGQTWSELDFPTTLANGSVAVAERDGADVLYVGLGAGGSETGIYTYAEGTWTRLEEDFGGLYSNNLLVHPDDPNTLFATFESAQTVGSLYKSIDGGDTWDVLSAGLVNVNHLGAMAIQPDAPDTIYLAGQDGGTNYGMLFKSTDAGETWSEYYQGMRQEFFYDLLFDGLVSTNDRGVFDLKSLGKVKLKKKDLSGPEVKLTVTLKDAATLDLLEDKKVRVYRKPEGKSWKEIDSEKTNANGKKVFTVSAKKGTKLKIVWKPSEADSAEYTRSVSRVIEID